MRRERRRIHRNPNVVIGIHSLPDVQMEKDTPVLAVAQLRLQSIQIKRRTEFGKRRIQVRRPEFLHPQLRRVLDVHK